jgi:hypothetical protein
VFAFALTLAFVFAQGQDRVIGLLKLPEVFSEGPCKPFEPRAVPLYADADGTREIGTVRVDQNWSFAPHGGCEGLEVRVHRGAERSELPTREYDYEAPAAIVLEQRGLSFRIRLDEGSAWVRAPFADRFISYESLLEEFVGVTFVTTELQQGELRIAAGQPVRVSETRHDAGRLMLHVEILSHSVCNAFAEGPPEVTGAAWIPAHTASGEPSVWYSSRGC